MEDVKDRGKREREREREREGRKCMEEGRPREGGRAENRMMINWADGCSLHE